MENIFDIRDNVLEHYNGTDADIVVPEGVTEIEDAFVGNETIRSVSLPSTLRDVSAWIFEGCSALEKITVNENNPYLKQHGQCIYGSDLSALKLYPSYLEAAVFEVPEFVKEIHPFAFCTSRLKKVVCNSGLKKIDDFAFCKCPSLNEITLPDTLTELGMHALYTEQKAVSLKHHQNGAVTLKLLTEYK